MRLLSSANLVLKKDGVVKIAHEELPGDQCFTSGDSYGYKGFDVCYNDWEEGFKRPNNSGKPGFIREYYDYVFPLGRRP